MFQILRLTLQDPGILLFDFNFLLAQIIGKNADSDEDKKN